MGLPVHTAFPLVDHTSFFQPAEGHSPSSTRYHHSPSPRLDWPTDLTCQPGVRHSRRGAAEAAVTSRRRRGGEARRVGDGQRLILSTQNQSELLTETDTLDTKPE
eukprot:Selendium_serpulae@DN11589_c0_g1_i1.p2